MIMRKHEPGPQLDALVAEKVMGWQIKKVGKGYAVIQPDGKPYNLGGTEVIFCDLPGARNVLPPHSTDIARAWEVVRRIGPWVKKPFYKSAVTLQFYEHDGVSSCQIHDVKLSGDGVAVQVMSDSLPETYLHNDKVAMALAICLAALEALELFEGE
jgi:Phage ABA sandwich domain